MMEVWVHENGEYEQRCVMDVYDSAIFAMMSIGGKWRRYREGWRNGKSDVLFPHKVLSGSLLGTNANRVDEPEEVRT